jgi:hypothetical protein
MTKRLLTPALTVFCALISSTCGGGGTGAPPGPQPDFAIAVSPGTVSGSAGGSTNPTSISITGLNGFTGNVIINVTGLPPGSTTTPALPFAIPAGSSQAFSVGIPGNAAQGNVALTLTGTAGMRTHSVALVLSIGPTPGPDFSIAATPGTVTASPGSSSSPTTVSITALNGFSGNVTVSLTGLPPGATTSPTQPFTVAAGATRAVTIDVPVTVFPGSVSLVVNGASGALAHSVSLVLNVSSPAAGSDQIVVVGHTDSQNFPTALAAIPNPQGLGDGFVSSVRLAGGVSSPTFSTFFGGNSGEQIRDAFLDSQGNLYITGQTASSSIPSLLPAAATAGVHRAFCNACSTASSDAFVAKFSPSGQALRFTYLGGTGSDEGYNIFVDSAGFIYVGGRTSSADYPITLGSGYAGGTFDMHVTKLTADLSTIVWARFLGGSDEDTGRGRLEVDAAGNVYLGGETRSNDFIGAQGQLNGATDPVVVKLNANGGLVYGRLFGGANSAPPEGAPGGLKATASGEVFVCGLTNTATFPFTVGPAYGGGPTDVFIARLSSTGQVTDARLLGGNGLDECHGLELDRAGNPIVLTMTNSTNYPIAPNPQSVFQSALQGGTDFAVTKLNASLSQIAFSTYLGASGNEAADTLRIETDPNGNLFFAGHTTSANIPWITANALQSAFGGGSHDLVLVVLSADGRQVLYASYFGGSGADVARSVRYRRNP